VVLFRRNKIIKSKILNQLEKEKHDKEVSFYIDLDDRFQEQSTSVISQIKKTKFSFIPLLESTKTSVTPNSIFTIEVLDDNVTAVIASRKGLFLDIKHLKRYSYEDLHNIYQNILNKEVEYDRGWYESLENIMTIIFYETEYALPSEVVIIDNRLSDLYKVVVESSKFKDKKTIDNVLKKKFQSVSGYSVNEVHMTITQRPIRRLKDEGIIYVISMVEKEYFDSIEDHLKSSGLILKRYHSIGSSLYASFFLHGNESKMRIHISNNTAYVMEKHEDDGFEYHQFDLDSDIESLVLMAYGMQETILSGDGQYYEEIKAKFADTKAESIVYGDRKLNIRSFSYEKDLDSCIIRLEKGIELNSSYANIISTAYHELFKVNFSALHLGVTKHVSAYDYAYRHLKVLPFLLLFILGVLSYGVYMYLKYEYDVLNKSHLATSEIVESKKRLTQDIARYDNNIRSAEKRIEKIKKLFSMRTESVDAIILHEIAQKLPEDIILTKIEKKLINKKESIKITGKCYQEISLLNYIKDLKIKDKRVFLISLTDSRKSKREEEDDSVYTALHEEERPYAIRTNKKIPQMARVSGINDINGSVSTPIARKTQTDNIARLRDNYKSNKVKRLNLEEKMVYYSDTINNTFILEIK